MRLNIGKGIEWDFDGWFLPQKDVGLLLSLQRALSWIVNVVP